MNKNRIYFRKKYQCYVVCFYIRFANFVLCAVCERLIRRGFLRVCVCVCVCVCARARLLVPKRDKIWTLIVRFCYKSGAYFLIIKRLTQIKTSLLGPANALATSTTFWYVEGATGILLCVCVCLSK